MSTHPTSPGTQRRKAILDKVEACVCKDRQNQYGDAEDNFQVIADYWNIWLRQRGILQETAAHCVNATDVAMMSALIKVARASSSPGHIDNWVDLAGYAICAGGIERKRDLDQLKKTDDADLREIDAAVTRMGEMQREAKEEFFKTQYKDYLCGAAPPSKKRRDEALREHTDDIGRL